MSMENSDRNEFIGAHTTTDVKMALENEAKTKNVSMSWFMHEALVEKLKKLGYTHLEKGVQPYR